MAGSYPDPIARRLEYDRDGSAVVLYNTSITAAVSDAVKAAINDEETATSTTSLSAGYHLSIVFTTPTVISAFYVYGTINTGSLVFEGSVDTTTGTDGTWTTLHAGGDPIQTSGHYRTLYTTGLPVTLNGVRVRRTGGVGGSDVHSLHLYGYKLAATGDWLEMWHPTLDQKLSDTPALCDLGDRGLNTGYASFSYRVKNMSATLTANGVIVSKEALTDGTPPIVPRLTMNLDGGAFGDSVNIGNLAPGAISDIIEARVNIDADGPLGLHAPRMIAAATLWV